MSNAAGTLTIPGGRSQGNLTRTLAVNQRWNNEEQTCDVGYTGDAIPAGTYTADTQAAANALAESDLVCVLASFPLESNNTVLSLIQQPSGNVVAGGLFTTVGGATHNYIVRFDEYGVIDATFNPTFNGSIRMLRAISGNRILCLGSFSTVNSTSRGGICILNNDGTLHAFNPTALGFTPAEDTTAAAELYNGDILVAASGFLRRMDASTGATVSWVSAANFTLDMTRAIAVIGQDVYIGGGFMDYSGAANTNGLVKFNDAGTRDSGFACSFTGNGSYDGPEALIVAGDGNILAVGDFESVNGTTRKCMAKINPATGALITAFPDVDVGSSANMDVDFVAEQEDGKFIIAGDFDDVGGVARSYWARVNADGTLDSSWNLGTWSPSNLAPPLILESGNVFLGCAGTASGGQTIGSSIRNGFAKLDSTGALLPLV